MWSGALSRKAGILWSPYVCNIVWCQFCSGWVRVHCLISKVPRVGVGNEQQTMIRSSRMSGIHLLPTGRDERKGIITTSCLPKHETSTPERSRGCLWARGPLDIQISFQTMLIPSKTGSRSGREVKQLLSLWLSRPLGRRLHIQPIPRWSAKSLTWVNEVVWGGSTKDSGHRASSSGLTESLFLKRNDKRWPKSSKCSCRKGPLN